MTRRTAAAVLFSVLASTLVTGAAPASAAPPAPRSTFDVDTEGWWAVTNGSLTGVTRVDEFGRQYLRADIPGAEPNVTYFLAPASFTGNLSAWLGGQLTFDLNADPLLIGPPETFTDVVVISGGGHTVSLDLAPRFFLGRNTVPLDTGEANWTLDGAGAATNGDLAAVLANVSSLRIRAEYYSADDQAVGHLDNVRLGFANSTTDFTGDGLPDRTVFRPYDVASWSVPDQDGVVYGTSGDLPVVGDYDGDGTADEAVFRPSTNRWYVRGIGTFPFGTAGDIPAPGDYNGDGITDMAVFRPSTGRWHIRNIATTPFGTNGDIPVPMDYDLDGDTDLAVFRPSSGTWHVRGFGTFAWGTAGDIPVPGLYVAHNQQRLTVYRPSTGTWHIRNAERVAFGTAGDIPVPADYDGDGLTDIAVYRPSTGTFHIRGIGNFGPAYGGGIPTIEQPSVRLARVAASPPVPVGLDAPAQAQDGEAFTVTVVVSKPVTSDTTVNLSADPSLVLPLPPTINAGQASTSFTVFPTAPHGFANLLAEVNGGVLTARIEVVPPES